MALEVVKGVTTARTTAGTTQVSPSGITDLKAVIVWCTYETADGGANADNIFSHGFATKNGGTIQQVYTTYFSDDAIGTSDVARGMNNNAVLKVYSASATVDGLATVSAMDATSFTLDYNSNPFGAAVQIHYLALGGSDISAARAFTTTQSTTSPQDVTIVSGFGKPDLLFFSWNASTALGDAANSAGLSMGIGKDENDEYCGMYADIDGATTMNLISYTRAACMVNSGGSVDSSGELDAKANWPTDGYRMLWPDTASSAWSVIGLALKGTFTSTIFTGTAPTSAQSQNKALASGTPKGALIFTHQNVLSTTQQLSGTSLGGWGMGGMDGTNEGYAGVVNEDANTAAICGRRFSQTKFIETLDAVAAGAPTVRGSADSSFSGSNLVIDWNADPDTVATEYWGVIFGQAAAAQNTLDAQPGSYAWTGSVAGLIEAAVINAQPGSYAWTGSVAGLPRGLFVNAQPGTYTFTGFQAGLLAARSVNAQPGSYTWTGFVADLVFGGGAQAYELDAQPTVYSWTGFTAGVNAQRVLNAQPASYSMTGFQAGLPAARVMNASPADYVLSGFNAGLDFSGAPPMVIRQRTLTGMGT